MPKRKPEHKAFSRVMDHYLEVKGTHGSSSCTGVYKTISREGAGRAGMNQRVVAPSPSDFIADVELSARRALSKTKLHAAFVKVYVNGTAEPDTLLKEERETIETLVGRMFMARGIAPTSLYFKAKDCR